MCINTAVYIFRLFRAGWPLKGCITSTSAISWSCLLEENTPCGFMTLLCGVSAVCVTYYSSGERIMLKTRNKSCCYLSGNVMWSIVMQLKYFSFAGLAALCKALVISSFLPFCV